MTEDPTFRLPQTDEKQIRDVRVAGLARLAVVDPIAVLIGDDDTHIELGYN